MSLAAVVRDAGIEAVDALLVPGPPYPPRLGLVEGPPGVDRAVLAAVTRALVGGGRVVWVDGGNHFDPYLAARVARTLGVNDRPVLERLFISRAFTAHQMAALVGERLAPGARAREASAVVVSDPLPLFGDPDIPRPEARRLFEATVRALVGLAAERPVVVVCPDPRPGAEDGLRFLGALRASARCVVRSPYGGEA